jgi:hypothetical protein
LLLERCTRVCHFLRWVTDAQFVEVTTFIREHVPKAPRSEMSLSRETYFTVNDERFPQALEIVLNRIR